jgi:ankyrin repeat protein
MTSAHIALTANQSAMAQLLLEHGATAVLDDVVPGHCGTGITALMACATADTAKVVLAAGADVHVVNEANDTCLHAAVRHKLAVPVACLLIKASADLHAINNEGKTAAHLAHDAGSTLLHQLLNRAAQQQAY